MYVYQDSPTIALDVEERLYSAIESLAHFPDRGTIAAESEEWGYTIRVLIVFRYRVLYVVRQSDVFVLRVVHGSRLGPVNPPD
jgi:plasmid stabilization system protein ParE